jgi:hypothetical protein
MKFSSFIILTAAGLAVAAPITPVSTDKTLTIQPAEVVKRQTSLDPVVDAAHGKLPVPIKRATPSVSSLGALTGAVPGGLPVKRGAPSVSSLGALTGAVPGGLPVGKRQLGGLIPSGSSTDDDSSESAEEKEPKTPKEPKEPSTVTDGTTEIDDGTAESSTSSAASALGGLPIGKRQLGGLIPSGSSTDDSSESAEEKEPKTPKEPKEPSTVTDGKTEIDDGTEESSTSSATSALGGLPIGKRQLGGITDMLSPKPADPKPATDASEEAPADDAAAEEPKEGEEDAEEPKEGEDDAPAEGEEAAPPADEEEADESPLAGILKRQETEEGGSDDSNIIPGILKRQLGGLTKGLIPSSDPEDAAAKDPVDATEEATTPASETAEDTTKPVKDTADEATPAEVKPAVESTPAKNATEPAPAKKQGLAGLLGM